MFKFNKLHMAMVLAASAAALTGCGGSGQDEGEVNETRHSISGRAIDGYIARSRVYLDTNGSARMDPWEPRAFTDDAGYFSYNPLTEVDYCAADASEREQRYCLRINGDAEGSLLRVSGGYDVMTGEPFVGQLSRRLTASDDGAAQTMIVSPLTTLISAAESDNDRATLLNLLGVQEADLDVDYLNTDGTGTVDAGLYQKSLEVQKVTQVLSTQLNTRYDEFGSSNSLSSDTSSYVYRSLASEIVDSHLDDVLHRAVGLQQVLTQAEQDVIERYHAADMDMPWEGGLSPDLSGRIAEQAAQVAEVIDRLTTRHLSAPSQEAAKGVAGLVEVATVRASDTQNRSEWDVQQTLDFLLDDSNTAAVDTLVDALGGERSDLSNLLNHRFQGDESPEELRALASVREDAQPFENLGGLSLKVSDPDLGYGPNELKDTELELYFEGDHGDLAGTFSACIKYIDGASIDGTLGDGNTRGELIEGDWSLLGATRSNPQSYNLVLTIDFAGASYEAIIKSTGMENVNGELQHKLRFDHNGEISNWHSALGLQPVAHLPESNQDCRDRLPSRIGL